MTRYVNPNFVRASNLILIGAALGIGMYFIVGSFTAFFQLGIFALTILVIVVIALLIRQGYIWAKWVYVIITGLFLFTLFYSLPAAFKENVIAGWLSVLQNLLDIAALILLFLPSKEPMIESTETTII